MIRQDSVRPRDSAIHRRDTITRMIQPVDSVSRKPVDSVMRIPLRSFSQPELEWEILKHHPYFGFDAAPAARADATRRIVRSKDLLFYLLIGILLLYAFMRQAFPKYFSDLFRLFFRTTLKQRQIREQLMQTPLPSLLLNGYFVLTGGLLLAFVLEHFGLNPAGNFWILYFYCAAGLAAIYLAKFIGLKLAGWLFNAGEAADSYIFVVFFVNKMISILVLPFLVLLAFTSGMLYLTALTLAGVLIATLIFYRFILTYTAVRNQVKVNLFHFLLYLAAFEIAPLLLIYRGLILLFGRTL